jgi:hypothetical protein
MTFEEAKALKPGTVLYSCIAAGYKDKRPLRARVNGVPQTWKTRPNEVRVPMKYGPRTTFQLHEDRLHEWELTEEAAAARIKQG